MRRRERSRPPMLESVVRTPACSRLLVSHHTRLNLPRMFQTFVAPRVLRKIWNSLDPSISISRLDPVHPSRCRSTPSTLPLSPISRVGPNSTSPQSRSSSLRHLLRVQSRLSLDPRNLLQERLIFLCDPPSANKSKKTEPGDSRNDSSASANPSRRSSFPLVPALVVLNAT